MTSHALKKLISFKASSRVSIVIKKINKQTKKLRLEYSILY